MRVVEGWFVWGSTEKWVDVECYLLEDGLVIIAETSIVFSFAEASVERKGVGFVV
jgi:hypothetical protein